MPPFVFHHVGVAVHDIAKALEYYTGVFGFTRHSETTDVTSQNVRVCFVKTPGGELIELVEGVGPDSPVREILSRTGAGTYHICYEVPDLDAAVAGLRRQGFFRLRRFEQPIDGGVRRFAFMLTPDRQLFELCEPERKSP